MSVWIDVKTYRNWTERNRGREQGAFPTLEYTEIINIYIPVANIDD